MATEDIKFFILSWAVMVHFNPSNGEAGPGGFLGFEASLV